MSIVPGNHMLPNTPIAALLYCVTIDDVSTCVSMMRFPFSMAIAIQVQAHFPHRVCSSNWNTI